MACLMCLLINEYESPECVEPPIMALMVFFMGGRGDVRLSRLSSLLSLRLSPLLSSSPYV